MKSKTSSKRFCSNQDRNWAVSINLTLNLNLNWLKDVLTVPEPRAKTRVAARGETGKLSTVSIKTCHMLDMRTHGTEVSSVGYSNKADICHGCLKGFGNSWAFKVQSFCLACFWSILESDSFAHHTLPCVTQMQKATYLAFREQPSENGLLEQHACWFGKQKDSEVTQTENWFQNI